MPITLDIVITGDDLIANAASRVMTQADAIQRAEVEPFGGRYHEALQNATPRGKGPGEGRKRLYESYEVTESYSTSGASYQIINQHMAVGYVIKGRPAVVAKEGKMLRFVIDGQVFYRKRVGPAKANPFDEKVATDMQSDADGLGERIAGRVIREYNGGQG